MATCLGGSETTSHCCYVAGEVCRFLEKNTVTGRVYACGLRRKLGSWDAVHADPGYRKYVQPVWDIHGIIKSCGDFRPDGGESCCFGGGD